MPSFSYFVYITAVATCAYSLERDFVTHCRLHTSSAVCYFRQPVPAHAVRTVPAASAPPHLRSPPFFIYFLPCYYPAVIWTLNEDKQGFPVEFPVTGYDGEGPPMCPYLFHSSPVQLSHHAAQTCQLKERSAAIFLLVYKLYLSAHGEEIIFDLSNPLKSYTLFRGLRTEHHHVGTITDFLPLASASQSGLSANQQWTEGVNVCSVAGGAVRMQDGARMQMSVLYWKYSWFHTICPSDIVLGVITKPTGI